MGGFYGWSIFGAIFSGTVGIHLLNFYAISQFSPEAPIASIAKIIGVMAVPIVLIQAAFLFGYGSSQSAGVPYLVVAVFALGLAMVMSIGIQVFSSGSIPLESHQIVGVALVMTGLFVNTGWPMVKSIIDMANTT